MLPRPYERIPVTTWTTTATLRDMKPLIGLPGSQTLAANLSGNLPVLDTHKIDVYYSLYARAVVDAGGLPVHLPLDVDPREFVERLDGILLTGGADINPSQYGHEVDGSVDIDDLRDELELKLLDGAIELKVPVLGICRGLQVINVHAGGTLHQHVPSHTFHDDDGSATVHEVNFELATTLGGIYGARHDVNSLHHQSIDALGDDLVVAGRSPDGSIEAIERSDSPVIAVQWHPEMLPTRPADPVFRWLVDASS